MTPVELVALAASTSLLAGWRLYLVTLITGLGMKFGWIALPDHLEALDVLANNWVLAIAAVAVTSSNEVLAKEWEDDVAGSARSEQMESKAMAMEASVAQKAAQSGEVDIVCVDGSLLSRLLKSTAAEILAAVTQYGSAIFIS